MELLNFKRRLKRLEALIAGAGGGGASIAPLPRLRYIAGDTTQSGNTGSIAEPYSTIAKWTAALGLPASANDANQPLVGYLVPAVGGYTEATVYPAGRNVLLTTDPAEFFDGTVTGNATWANTTVANPPTLAIIEERNVQRIGNFTVTDDGTAATSIVLFASTNLAAGSGLSGNFVSNTTQHLEAVIFYNTIVASVTCGTAANSGAIETDGNAQFTTGTVTALSLTAIGAQINSTAITVRNSCVFESCSFGSGVGCVLTTGTGVGNANTFDGPSWRSYLSSGGTRAAGVIVLVVGGFYGGPVYGAALPTAGPVTTQVSLNGNGATAGYTGSNSGNVYVSAGLTANNIVQVLTGGGENVGDTVCITKTDLAAHTLTVQNNAGTVIGVIPSGGRGSIVMVKAGATAIGGITNDWALSNCGSLAA